jgi:hypothetical protein
MHSKLLHEGESAKREVQWWISRKFWPRKNICKAERSVFLAEDANRC